MKSYTDRIVWITGASSGIGAALARAFADDGARCVLSARNTQALEETRQSCRNPGGHLVLPMDVAEFDSHEALVERVYNEVGPVDVLVLNSGVSQRSGVFETRLDVLRRMMDVNFVGAASHARLVGARMAERGSGHIVAVTSVNGRISTPQRSAYSASKHAMHGFFESLRAETADLGVRVTIVCPGYVRTDISRNAVTGDGSPHGVTDATHQRGLDADVFAGRALRAIRRGRAEVHIGSPEVWGIQIFRFAPNLFRRMVRRYGR